MTNYGRRDGTGNGGPLRTVKKLVASSILCLQSSFDMRSKAVSDRLTKAGCPGNNHRISSRISHFIAVLSSLRRSSCIFTEPQCFKSVLNTQQKPVIATFKGPPIRQTLQPNKIAQLSLPEEQNFRRNNRTDATSGFGIAGFYCILKIFGQTSSLVDFLLPF